MYETIGSISSAFIHTLGSKLGGKNHKEMFYTSNFNFGHMLGHEPSRLVPRRIWPAWL